MTKFISIFIIALIGLISLTKCSQKKQNNFYNSTNKLEVEIDSLINESMNRGFRGTVLVAKKNEIILNKIYGDFKMETKTVFWIGSISKQFTATAILKLQENNQLSVNDSITKFVEDVPLDKKGITIHHLLTHSSGLANNYPADGITNRKEAINTILSSPLKYGIGEKYSYSAEGYNLLAIIIEIISNKSFEKYVSQNLLAPANINQTGFWGIESENSTNTASYKNTELMKSFPLTIYHKGKSITNYGFKGATGIFSTTNDLYKWINEIKNNNVVNQKSIQQQFTPYSNIRGDTINGTFYGYGWFIEHKDGKLRETRHGGAEDNGIGHNAIIRFYNNGDIIIIQSNAGVYNGEGRLNGVEWSTVLSFDIREILEKIE